MIKRVILDEASRRDLIDKGKRGDQYVPSNRAKGKNRYERRKHSRIYTNVAQYNNLDMNLFFKHDILLVGIKVIGETDEYITKIKFKGILEEVAKEVKKNNNKLEFKTILTSLIRIFNTEDVFVSCSCLHPTTKIKLLDGTSPTVEEMKERFESGEKLFVFSTDEKGDFKPGEVENVWITKTTNEFIKITLDNDEEILTTPDHLYMLRDGSYVMAEELTLDSSLMPMYTSESNNYTTVKKYKTNGYPNFSRCFSNWKELSDYFNLNHKIVKIERIIIEDTPVYDISVKDYHNFTVDAGVVLHNCEDWKYRQAYWATQKNYNSGPMETRVSDITNPSDSKGSGCKHVMLVLANMDWILKVTSVINNYIKYAKQFMQRLYADYIFPKIYGMRYDRAIQLDIFDTDDFDSSPFTIDDINKIGRKSGQFTPGNPYRFQKKETSEPKETLPLEFPDDENTEESEKV